MGGPGARRNVSSEECADYSPRAEHQQNVEFRITCPKSRQPFVVTGA